MQFGLPAAPAGKFLLEGILPYWEIVKSFGPFNTCVSEAEFQQANLTTHLCSSVSF